MRGEHRIIKKGSFMVGNYLFAIIFLHRRYRMDWEWWWTSRPMCAKDSMKVNFCWIFRRWNLFRQTTINSISAVLWWLKRLLKHQSKYVCYESIKFDCDTHDATNNDFYYRWLWNHRKQWMECGCLAWSIQRLRIFAKMLNNPVEQANGPRHWSHLPVMAIARLKRWKIRDNGIRTSERMHFEKFDFPAGQPRIWRPGVSVN